jgi:hypothetical protein
MVVSEFDLKDGDRCLVSFSGHSMLGQGESLIDALSMVVVLSSNFPFKVIF